MSLALLASAFASALAVIGLVRRGPVQPKLLRLSVIGAVAAFAVALWALDWIRYFGSTGGVSVDPSMTARVLTPGAYPAPSKAPLALALISVVLGIIARPRRSNGG